VINQKAQEIIGRILTFGVLGITLFVEPWRSSEPINAPKMLLLSICAFSALFVIGSSWNRILWDRFKTVLIVVLSFIFFSTLSVVLSKDNILVGLFGIKGRSTGLITYFSLALLFLASAMLQSKRYYGQIIKFLLVAGAANLIYNLMYIFGFDPIPWNNPYRTILGTFGNPNFISSFLGIIVSALFALLLDGKSNKKARILAGCTIPIAFFQIIFSNSIQGVFVSAIGCAAVFFFFIRSKSESRNLNSAYICSVISVGLIAILGMLQKGPLASYIYKPSVSFRGEYWAAGLNMGMSNPLTGVGLDSYGTWYRLYRRPSALERPGQSVVSDSAHNVFIDFFASGGFPLLFAYFVIQLLVLHAIWKIIKNSSSFDATPVALIAGWIGFTSQSIISINQVGLAVWGWVLGGSIIGYAKLIEDQTGTKQKISKSVRGTKVQRSEAAISLAAIAGLVIGTLIALPPVRSDMAWRSALKSANAGDIEKAMSMWPRNQRTLNAGIVLFANNGLAEKALEWARIDVEQNSENYVSWFTLYQLQGVPDIEKLKIYEKLHELDPLNKEFQK
jgi:O-antigen ligase